MSNLSNHQSARPALRRQEVDLRLVPAGFLALIAVGTFLLVLPWAQRPGQFVGALDAFFLATSAACVTGLTTVNVAETFSPFGQVVLLGLIQFGGLGILTAGILLVLVGGNRLSLADEQTIHATVGRLRQARPLDLFIYACVFVFLLELAGAVGLFALMTRADPAADPAATLWAAVFHAVSAFCNAGVSNQPEGMMRWRGEPALLAIIAALVLAGSIGLMTLINLRYFQFWRRDPRRRGRMTFQTKLCVAAAAALLAAGTLLTWLFEPAHTHATAGLAEQLTWAAFHSAMRTAGFTVVNVDEMNPPTLLGTLALMFIGGAPGSMAGGIKTVTFVVLLATAWTALRRRGEVQFWGRRIAPVTSNVAALLTLLAAGCVAAGVGLLMVCEDGHAAAATRHGWLALVFEAVSAFGTVGLSTGVTPLLTPAGKLVIVALMFLGRVGTLVLAVYLARPANPLRVRHPREELALG